MTKNKLYSILLSVAIAFGLWLYVITSVSPNSEDTYYNIPVVMENESVLNERGLMLTSASTSAISLELAGTRSDLSKVSSQTITVKVNLATIYEPGQQIVLEPDITYPNGMPKTTFEVLSKSEIYVSVEKRVNKEVPVEIVWTGTRSGNYLYDTENALLDYTTINVIGPASSADLIEKAVIEIDLTDRVESISESFRYTLCDAEGEPVDAAEITTNVEEVRLEMKIQQIKEVKLVANVIYGGGASEKNTTVEVSPSTIRVSGSEAALAELGETITLCTVNLGEMEKSANLDYTISLPEGVTNQTGVSEATVSVKFSGLSSKEFTIEDITAINIPENMKVDIINAKLTVKVRGSSSDILRLTEEDIAVTVDMSAAEAGTATYKATVVISEDFPEVGAMGSYSVSVTVQTGG